VVAVVAVVKAEEAAVVEEALAAAEAAVKVVRQLPVPQARPDAERRP
jgi:hypothetical protein